jgi:hypothetical protein
MEKFTNFQIPDELQLLCKFVVRLGPVTSKRRRSQQSSSASAICKTIHKHKVPAIKTQKGSRELQFANNSNNNITTKTCSHKTCEVLQTTATTTLPLKPAATKLVKFCKQQTCTTTTKPHKS